MSSEIAASLPARSATGGSGSHAARRSRADSEASAGPSVGADAGEADLRWQLEVHLLPTFARHRLDTITVEDVDRFRRAKVREGRLNATSINKCLATLAAIMELAVEYGHVDRNPAKGKRRRLPSVTPRRTYLDRGEQIGALLDAAAALDRASVAQSRSAGRCSRCSCSPVCGSTRRSHCAGGTST